MLMTLIGLAFMSVDDEKVRRWTLNTFARIGNEDECVDPLQHVLSRMPPGETHTAAAGVAAVYKLMRKGDPRKILAPFGIPPQLQTLAALQHVAPAKLDLSALPLDVDTASPDYLRLALLVIGLGKSPINMLNPRHADAVMVKALGGHSDPIVSQYSVWAITENPNLGLADLGIDLQDVEGKPDNVRAWVYRLIAMDAGLAEQNFDNLVVGSIDRSAEARAGLIHGLRDVYIDGLDDLILNWLPDERDPEVLDRLYEHMVRQSGKCSNYAEYVVEIYAAEPSGSALRKRLEGNAFGTPLFARFRDIAYSGSADLFKQQVTTVTNNTFVNNGTMNTGALSQTGSASNEGGVNVQHYNPQQITNLKTQLGLAEQAIKGSSLGKPDRDAALGAIEAAKNDPTPGKVQKAISALDNVGKIAGAGVALAPVLTPIMGAISSALGFG